MSTYTSDLLKDLAAREAQLKALNDELDAKKSSTISSAASLIKQHEQKLSFPQSSLDSGDNIDAGKATTAGKRPSTGTLRAGQQPKPASVKATSTIRPTSAALKTTNTRLSSSGKLRSSFAHSNAPAALNYDDAFLADSTTDYSAAAADFDTTDPTTGLSNQSASRIHQAQIKALSETLTNLRSEYEIQSRELNELREKAKELTEVTQTQQKKLLVQEQTVSKTQQQHTAGTDKITTLENTITDLRKQLDAERKTNKQLESDSSSKDTKLNRLSSECERLKVKLKEHSSTKNDVTESKRKELLHLQSDNKRLMQQRSELILAFRKQLKLIDVLKKQKLHLESARMLQFSEQEFANAIQM